MSSTIGALARRYGLSRSTLLYYDRIGLLRPAGRSANGYRQYAPADEARLEKIVTYRNTGASMRDIRRMLDDGSGSLRVVLDQRLQQLNEDIAGLREQQRFILGLLKCRKGTSRVGVMNVRLWIRLLEASGVDEEARNRWHSAFERSSPASHQRFLEFLRLPHDEIARIRRRSREGTPATAPPPHTSRGTRASGSLAASRARRPS
jgi:DNA-binding transcriptional MerR regulator